MPSNTINPQEHLWTASELRRLPPHERDAIFAAAKLAEESYRNDAALTAFEAFERDPGCARSACDPGLWS